MALILLLDTSSDSGFYQVCRDGLPVGSPVITGKDHAAYAVVAIREACLKAGISLNDLDAIALCNGPGSYTGLRIGLATAKGLAYATGLKLILHNKLLLLMRSGMASVERSGEACNAGLLILPARTGEYFAVAMNHSGAILLDPAHYMEDILFEWVKTSAVDMCIFGRADSAAPNLPAGATWKDLPELDVSLWANVAEQDYAHERFADVATSEPFYLKSVHISIRK